ncbi:unnamed protein product [Microthlaspi erraticum]|uniref:Uncharacterized protein n=1 Tax=Microthlaspi erraticum TaxID=1685480 RepID=A0A6D2JG05_9BRAS|nr:unnamed protein product [Microthlaspi erraticum]
MTYRELIRRVKSRLNIVDPNIAVKLAYQYPDWLVIDDVDGSTPEYITDDQEVDVFIEMRRNIEEVNLCVTISKTISGITTTANGARKRVTTDARVPIDPPCAGEEDGMEVEAEWLGFAMSETPLTSGITIREPEPVIRLASPVPSGKDKGKGVALYVDSDTDGDEEDVVVPQFRPAREAMDADGDRSVPVRRQLFPDALEFAEGTTSESGHDEEGETNYVPQGDLPTWGRFEQALHEMLTDVSQDPTLFGRDAPPVFERALNCKFTISLML